jgi:hypothetical protein
MNKILEKINTALHSRTVWTIVVLFIINGIKGVQNLLPPEWLPAINLILSFLAIYFRVNPQAGVQK